MIAKLNYCTSYKNFDIIDVAYSNIYGIRPPTANQLEPRVFCTIDQLRIFSPQQLENNFYMQQKGFPEESRLYIFTTKLHNNYMKIKLDGLSNLQQAKKFKLAINTN